MNSASSRSHASRSPSSRAKNARFRAGWAEAILWARSAQLFDKFEEFIPVRVDHGRVSPTFGVMTDWPLQFTHDLDPDQRAGRKLGNPRRPRDAISSTSTPSDPR